MTPSTEVRWQMTMKKSYLHSLTPCDDPAWLTVVSVKFQKAASARQRGEKVCPAPPACRLSPSSLSSENLPRLPGSCCSPVLPLF